MPALRRRALRPALEQTILLGLVPISHTSCPRSGDPVGALVFVLKTRPAQGSLLGLPVDDDALRSR
jgi:hypothetical protein